MRPSRSSVLPRAWQWSPDLSDEAFAHALATVALDDLVVLAQRWRAQQTRERSANARREQALNRHRAARGAPPRPTVPASGTGSAPIAGPSTVLSGTPVAVEHLLLDRLAALARHPGWATHPEDARWGTVLQAVMGNVSPLLPTLAVLHLGHAPLLDRLIERGGVRRLGKPSRAPGRPRPDDHALGQGVTPLHAMAQRFDPVLLQRALAAGAPLDVRTSTGITPLMAVVLGPVPPFEGEAVVLAWVQRRAGPAASSALPVPPPVLRDRVAGETAPVGPDPLVERLDLLLAHGADLHALTDSGNNLLHLAMAMADPWLIAPLLERGADPSQRNRKGLTPLEMLDDRTSRTRQTVVHQGHHLQATPHGALVASVLMQHEATLGRQEATLNAFHTAMVERERRALLGAMQEAPGTSHIHEARALTDPDSVPPPAHPSVAVGRRRL